MSRAPAATATQEGAAGTPVPAAGGTLVFVVGPSGAGKDTLLAYARRRLDGGACGARPVVFARRLITRPVDATEDHIEIDAAGFEAAAAAGRFPLHWRANGLGYALGEDCRAGLAAGHLVVANGSRAAVKEARARFSDVRVVLVSAPPEVLARRLAARGREAAPQVAERLARDPALETVPELTLMNDGPVEAAGERLVAYLAGM
ncbi:phosphonate metabolism protein/1,5-bisphosphokinase (PRPP-forming) PhnN [Ancylobacter lacus]|uniref:phosphonate metabolism protein/1,5-bisphosphokinase (PRPP-forming) PhnN n=1 Tax=Ancylobacter lacus TaxID=2579970 RepID=UPI001BCFC5A5|nr:phosphonate metabolism protein/1,5-bisphosphokinase (PRPP-forming) PhnN [Ancylobacter lacus]MBS7537772.1 phosphonate metabolism protein/1,5-bisphosphokinase (PRPP-forming) PhnN [Ancylobacter lacus]